MKTLTALLVFVFSLSAQAHFIGSVSGVIKAGCDACTNPYDGGAFGNYIDFGLGQNADLTGQRYTFTFSMADIVFAYAPLFDDQGGVAVTIAVFRSNGSFFFNHRIDIGDPVAGTANWNSGFSGSAGAVKPLPAVVVSEPGPALLILAGLFALLVRRRWFGWPQTRAGRAPEGTRYGL